MSQTQTSVDETASSTKQMVEIKEKLKLKRSASNAQAANKREKEEKTAKRFKIVFGR